MKQRLLRLTACFLAAGITFTGTNTVVLADKEAASVSEETAEAAVEETEETASLEESGTQTEEAEAAEDSGTEETGETAGETESGEETSGSLAFAQCEEYVNVRSAASTDGEIVAKLYNNDSATILGQEDGWYKIQSGNAVGYVKAEYLATGAEAEAIAEEVAYNVAVVHPDELNIRSEASTESGTIGVAYSAQELEVVDYQGDWMKVALGDDVYGYVNAYYVAYKTYYPTAETLEEEQARLAAEQSDAAAAQAAADAAYQAQLDAEAAAAAQAEAAAAAQAEADAAYQEYAAASESQSSEDTSEADAQYQAYVEAQAAADAQAQAEADAAAQAQAEADAAAAAQAAADAAAQAEADAAAQAAADAAASETAETVQTETASTESASTTESASSTGADIANYALQFVGNPYVWGGTSLTNGADCSGFTQSVFANFGISLPRTAADQSGSGTSVDLGSIQAGDLLFYSSGSGIDHVAIYIGGGSIVHAANASSGITTSSAYYSTPVAAVRCW